MATDIEHHARLLRYDAWANAEALASLRRTASAPGMRWMAHIAGSELLWLGRLQGVPSPVAVWPDLDADGAARHLDHLAAAWPTYLNGLTPDDLDEAVGYRNSLGEFWSNTTGDILTHVVAHSGYHRGQIASAVRSAGGEPAYTDYIHAVRRELVG